MRKTKIPYPGLRDTHTGKRQKLVAAPTDFDPDRHRALRDLNFTHSYLYLLHQANVVMIRAKRTAASLKADADALRVKGMAKLSLRVAKLQSVRRQEAALVETLQQELSKTEIDSIR